MTMSHYRGMTGRHSVSTVLRTTWYRSRGSISILIVYICVSIFLCKFLLSRIGFASNDAIVSFLGLSFSGVFRRGWAHQFLTAPLLHVALWHLIFNMLSLWMLGPGVERTLGRRRYIRFSILCALSSMVGFLLLNLNSNRIVLGYSGVIYGILVAQAVFFPNNIIYIYFYPLRMKHAALLLGVVAMYLTISGGGGIAHAAHLFGAVAAFVYLRGRYWWSRLPAILRS